MALVLPASADTAEHGKISALDRDQAYAFSQAAVGRTLADHRFRDRAGRTVRLSDFRGKPLVVSMIYTSCPHFCPMISQAVARATDIAAEAMGDDRFNIVSIGFDTSVDTPARMASWAKAQGLGGGNWRFLSTDRKTAQALAAELGFLYTPSPNGYDHLAQSSLVDAEGIVYAQVYGTDFEAPFLVEPMKALVFGRSSRLTSLDGLVNRVRLFCTVFNPATGRYDFDYSLFIVLTVGSTCLFGVGFVILRAWLHGRPRGRSVTRRA